MPAVNNRFTILPNEAFYDDELTPAEFRMLAVLYSFRDSNANTVWPKLETIQERAGYSDRTQVSRMTSRLEAKGWLKKGKKKGPRGPKVYELTVPDRVQLGANSQVDHYSQVDISEQESDVQKRQVDCSGQVDNSAQEPGVNLTGTPNSQVDCDGQLSNEHTSINKPITHQSSDAYASGAEAPGLVDNSLGAMEKLYAADNPCKAIFDEGVKFLAQYGHGDRSARALIGKLLAEHGESAVIDAMAKTMIYEPVDPPGWIMECLKRSDTTPMSLDWEPPGDWVENATTSEEVGGHGIPMDIIRKALDTFVFWFHEQGIEHHDWLDLFRRWCVQDWIRAEQQRNRYLKRLATSSGFGKLTRFAS